jgi:hypothetical protein
VAQSIGPEFKPQYCKKKERKKETAILWLLAKSSSITTTYFKVFYHLKKKHHTLSLIFLPSPSLGNLLCSTPICLLCAVYFEQVHINRITRYGLLCLASFSLHNAFKVHLCFGMQQHFTSFCGWVVTHCMDVSLFILGSLGCSAFWLLWMMLL